MERPIEDKEEIVRALGEVIKMTDAGYSLESLEYDMDDWGNEHAIARLKSGAMRRADITWDSGIAIIRDVMSQIFN